MMRYEELLERAFKQLPERKEEESRFTIPQARVFIEGKTTIFDNFEAVCERLNREKEHLMKFLLLSLIHI